MVFNLDTKTHGTIDAGYYGPFTQFANFGDYTFATKHLCDLVTDFADNPEKKEAGILSFNMQELEQMKGDYLYALLEILEVTHTPYVPVVSEQEMDVRLVRQQGRITNEQELALYDYGAVVPVKFDYDALEIAVGKYHIEPEAFCQLVANVSSGGLFGWMGGSKPNFAAETQDALLGTKNPLLATAQRYVESYLDMQARVQKKFEHGF